MINPIYYLYKMNSSLKKVIEDNIGFYKKLNKNDKRKFEYRISRFIKAHKFIGREEVVITPVKQVIIASIAVMVTFRMRNYLYDHFKNIIVYPGNYLSNTTQHYHKGETNPRAQAIVFSWKGLVDGIKIPNDNLNLGIHEFTHALYFSFLQQSSYEASQFIDDYDKILNYLKNPIQKQKLLDAVYFREYAFENQHEFLAVITENYFETPADFHTKLPKLFLLVNRLYGIY